MTASVKHWACWAARAEGRNELSGSVAATPLQRLQPFPVCLQSCCSAAAALLISSAALQYFSCLAIKCCILKLTGISTTRQRKTWCLEHATRFNGKAQISLVKGWWAGCAVVHPGTLSFTHLWFHSMGTVKAQLDARCTLASDTADGYGAIRMARGKFKLIEAMFS